MRQPSRRMPRPIRARSGVIAWALIALLLGGYGYTLWRWPFWAGAATAALVLFTVVQHRQRRRALALLAVTRSGDSLCSFARSFPRPDTDTWVLRAVYEELQRYLGSEHPAFPLRATDRLEEDLRIDPEDLDMDVAVDIAHRCGRTFDNTQQNPYHGRVKTVGDLVAFFCAQPRSAGEQADAADEVRDG